MTKTCTKCHEVKPLSEFGKKAQMRDGLQSQCKVCRNASKAVYRSDNREKIQSSAAVYYTNNREKIQAHRADNPDARRIHRQNRRASKRENGGVLSKGLAGKLFGLQRGKCACCGKPLGTDYHLDHIMPVALEGPNIDSNMQLLRSTCNMNKSAKHPVDFMQQKGFLL